MRKRIMLFSHICYLHYMTGAEKNLLFLARELAQNHECILVVPNEGKLAAEARKCGIPVLVLAYPVLWSLWNPHAFLRMEEQRFHTDPRLPALCKVLREMRPDFVVVNSCVNAFPAIAAKQCRFPVAWWLQEVIAKNSFTFVAAEMIDRYADWVLGLSHAVLQPLQGGNLQRKKFLFYPSWREEELQLHMQPIHRRRLRMKLGVDESVRLIGTVCADIVPHKGTDQFVQMAVLLGQTFRNVHFLVVGNPTDRAYFQQCVRIMQDGGMKNRFHHLPFESDVAKIYPALDVLVIPSLVDEGFGLTCLEGFLFRLPVVAYRAGGLSEIIGYTGIPRYLVEKRNVKGLAARVKELLENENLRSSVGERNRQVAVEAFGIARYRERLQAILTKLLPVPQQDALPNGVLLKGTGPGVYLLENGYKRPFASESAFHFFKFKRKRIIHIDDAELGRYPEGRPIEHRGQSPEDYPQTLFVRGTHSPVYLLASGIRYPLVNEEVLQRLRCGIGDIVFVPDERLRTFALGPPLTENIFAAHELVNGRLYQTPDGSVYYAEDRRLRKIESEKAFAYFKWNKAEAIPLSLEEWSRLPVGPPIRCGEGSS